MGPRANHRSLSITSPAVSAKGLGSKTVGDRTTHYSFAGALWLARPNHRVSACTSQRISGRSKSGDRRQPGHGEARHLPTELHRRTIEDQRICSCASDCRPSVGTKLVAMSVATIQPSLVNIRKATLPTGDRQLAADRPPHPAACACATRDLHGDYPVRVCISDRSFERRPKC
jgi:hypothetical protein